MPDLLQVFRMLFYNEINNLILFENILCMLWFRFQVGVSMLPEILMFVFLTFLHFVNFSQYYLTAVLDMFRVKKVTNSGVFGRGAQSCGVLMWFEFTSFSL